MNRIKRFVPINEETALLQYTPEKARCVQNITLAIALLDTAKTYMTLFSRVLFKEFPSSLVLMHDTGKNYWHAESFHPKNMALALACIKPFCIRIADSLIFKVKRGEYDPNRIKKYLCDQSLGLFKDEMQGEEATGFVGLAAKCYSLKLPTGAMNRSKGVPKYFVRRLPFEEYLKEFRKLQQTAAAEATDPPPRQKFYQLRSSAARIYLTHMEKRLFSTRCRKRRWLSCARHSLPYFRVNTPAKCTRCRI